MVSYTDTEKHVDPVEKKSEESVEVNQDLILGVLRKNYDGVANVELDENNKTYRIIYTNEDFIYAIKMIVDVDNPDTELIEVWDSIVENFVLLSKSISEVLPGYKLSLVNPANADYTLLIVLDGAVVYNCIK